MIHFRSFVLAALTLTPTAAILARSAPAAAQSPAATARGSTREIEIVVRGGYQPARIVVNEGERIRLRFVRREYSGCTREVVFPSLGLRRELPPNQPVIIELPAQAPGEIAFHCGMQMIHGTIVVQPRNG